MSKKFVLSLIIALFLAASAYADGSKELLRKGIKYYKAGNFLGAIQTLEEVVKDDPGSALAYYYTAISYVKIGDTEKANAAYEKVIAISPDSQLATYAKMGEKLAKPDNTDLPSTDGIIKKSGKGVEDLYSDSVEKKINQRNLKFLIERVNNNQKVAPSEYSKFKDYSPGKSLNAKPTEEEIAQAYQTLAKAGLNPAAMATAATTMNNAMSPEMMQMNMLSGAMGNQGGNNNMNMLPLIMMMQQQGQQGGQNNSNYDPELMQSMLTNMMMPNMMDMGSSGKNGDY